MPRKLCALLALAVSAEAQEHLNTLWPPKGRPEDHFGAALDSDGRRLVVSALRVDSPGVLFVYRREGANWIEEARLTNRSEPEYDAFDGFGWTAEISGQRVAASARFDQGRVFVFEQGASGAWTRSELEHPDPLGDHGFGNELELDGDTLVASTYPRRSLYVFEHIGGAWVRTLDLRTSGVNDFRLHGDTLVISASNPRLQARILERRIGVWTTTQVINTVQTPWIALDGDRLAVSAGETTVYERSGGTWTAVATIAEPVARLELSGSTLVRRRSTGSIVRGLHYVEVHERSGSGAWNLVRTIDRGGLEDPRLSIFAQDLALHGDELVLSSHDYHGTTLRSGIVLTYSSTARATLAASPQHLSLLTGDTLALALDAGIEHAGRPFILAGSLAGTSPGFSFGSHHIPLVRDRLYYPLSRQIGLLDGNGRATLTVDIPPLAPTFAHTTLHHAYVVFDPRRGLVHTSNVALTALNYRLVP